MFPSRLPPSLADSPLLLQRAACPKFRSASFCDTSGDTEEYHRYSPGAWTAHCTWPGFQLSAFPSSHLQASGSIEVLQLACMVCIMQDCEPDHTTMEMPLVGTESTQIWL